MWSSASFISIENQTNSTWKFVIKPNDNFKYAPGQVIQIKIKDIVRGTITLDIQQMYNAYNHFKNTQGVKIVAIKEKLYSL